MADFALDTVVEGQDGIYRAHLSRAWEIWGPNGGYLAAIALRAAGAASRFRRPASFACHYLSVAAFERVDLNVTVLRAAKRAESLRVTMTQHDRAILEAIVWVVDDNPGLEHDRATMPAVPQPNELRPVEEVRRPGDPVFPFWNNFDRRPVDWKSDENFVPSDPVCRQWVKFRSESDFHDPFLDAGRAILLVDTYLWPAAWRMHGESPYIAPSLDLSCYFHRPLHPHQWLLADAESPIAGDGLVGATARVWSPEGRLLASGGGQLYCRPVPQV